MTNHASAAKRLRRDEKMRKINHAKKNKMRTLIKKVIKAKEENSENLKEITREAQSWISKCSKWGIIHHNTASRRVARVFRISGL